MTRAPFACAASASAAKPPAGTSGNFALGGWDPAKNAGYVMYQISGGGYGGNCDRGGLTNGCSTIGISKSQPVEVLEQYYPILFTRFALREGSGGAGAQRGGFGVHYEVELLRGEARASFVMDHGRFGPPGVRGGGEALGGEGTLTTRRSTWELPDDWDSEVTSLAGSSVKSFFLSSTRSAWKPRGLSSVPLST